MLTIRATPKMSEKPIASNAYTPPFTSPLTRMSWNTRCSCLKAPRRLGRRGAWSLLFRHLERQHALHLRRPEWNLLAVLPLHRDACGLADSPHQIVALVPGVGP